MQTEEYCSRQTSSGDGGGALRVQRPKIVSAYFGYILGLLDILSISVNSVGSFTNESVDGARSRLELVDRCCHYREWRQTSVGDWSTHAPFQDRT